MEELSGVIFTGCNEFMLFIRKSVGPTVINLGDDGELTQGPGEALDYRCQHFKKLLNVQNMYDEDVMAAIIYNAICAPIYSCGRQVDYLGIMLDYANVVNA